MKALDNFQSVTMALPIDPVLNISCGRRQTNRIEIEIGLADCVRTHLLLRKVQTVRIS